MPQLPVKGTKNKQGTAKSPSITPVYSPNHRKLEKPQVTSQVNQGTFVYYFCIGNIHKYGITFTIQVNNPQYSVIISDL